MMPSSAIHSFIRSPSAVVRTAGQVEAMGMRYILVTFCLSCLLVQLVPLTADDDRPYFPKEECISGSGNYTNNSSYSADLSSLFTSFLNAQVKYGFYNFSVGEVNGIGLCRGDISSDKCHSCIRNSTQDIRQLCPNSREAILYQDVCMLRYSNRSIFGRQEYQPTYILYNTLTFPDPDASREKRDNLLLDVRDKAASGGTLRKYATGEASTSLNTIYALVQCTPDLEYQDCVACVANISDAALKSARYQQGLTAMAPSCSFRYETYAFYEPLLSAPPQSPPPSSDGKRKSIRARRIVIIVILAVVSVILIFCIGIYICFKWRKPKSENRKAEEELLEVESLQHSLGSIRDATDNFSDSNKLGQGGFGAVYKGRLPNGQDIAVKRLSQGSGQGELEFKNEVLLVAKLQHRNLVRLLGFCLEGTERLLIYEFVVNGSLDNFLFDPINCLQLSWERRYKIIQGIARGLLYLHEDSRLRIIHRDLKTSNILLDEKMNPKISDFGMAKLFSLDETQGDTKRIVGTYGYMAPEYAMFGNFSVKSDVYSFGILILEIVSGQKNSNFINGEDMEGLTNFAWRCWKEGSASNLIDPSINSGSISEIMRCIHIGLLCVQENPTDRPTMASIVLMLSSHSITLPLPSRPGFSLHSGTTQSMNCKTKLETPFLHDFDSGVTSRGDNSSTQISINEASISELYPR